MRRTPAQVGPVGEPRAPTTLLIPIPHTEFVRTLRLIAEKIVLFLSALLPLKDLSSAPAFHPVSHPYSKPGTRREARARERIIGHSTSPLYRTEGASNAFTSWSHGPETGAHSSHPHARALPALSPSVSRRSGRCCLCYGGRVAASVVGPRPIAREVEGRAFTRAQSAKGVPGSDTTSPSNSGGGSAQRRHLRTFPSPRVHHSAHSYRWLMTL
jgi:hypothetical protein